MKDFFEPADFVYNGYPLDVDFYRIAMAANKKLNAEIAKWPLVYGRPETYDQSFSWTQLREAPKDSHMARLAFITELPKKECNHEPIKVIDEFVYKSPLSNGEAVFKYFDKGSWQCSKCRKQIKPNWTAVE